MDYEKISRLALRVYLARVRFGRQELAHILVGFAKAGHSSPELFSAAQVRSAWLCSAILILFEIWNWRGDSELSIEWRTSPSDSPLTRGSTVNFRHISPVSCLCFDEDRECACVYGERP